MLANGSRAIILGTLLFAIWTRHWRKTQVRRHQANLIRSTQTRQRSRFNGIMNARPTNLHLFVVEREEEEDQTT